MEIDYSLILRSSRIRVSTVKNRKLLTEAESDRGRVLFSPAFRRLQQKAQVFSMEPNAAVRSRLTHSLEVAQIGRFIADQICVKLIEKNLIDSSDSIALINFVETACLMHDIGNPPFGHFGEAAIQKWFDDNGAEKIQSACGDKKDSLGTSDERLKNALADFLEFDGNPQGLRVVSKLQWNTDEFGLNLTKTSIASYLKYVRMAGDEKSKSNPEEKFTKKAGYFRSERKLVASIWKEFNYNLPQRFPLAYIMEAADDIAYCISDLEDSIEKELLNEKTSLKEIKADWDTRCKSNDLSCDNISRALNSAINGEDEDGKQFTYTDFRTSVNRIIVEYAASRYIKEQTKIFEGSLDSLVSKLSPSGLFLDVLKDYCKEKVYCHESVQRTELAGYTAIYGLLDLFGILLSCKADRFQSALNYSNNKDKNGKNIIIEKKYLKLFPEKYINVYKSEVEKITGEKDEEFLEWNARAHLIVDFISGMTDDFSMKTYRTLSGMII